MSDAFKITCPRCKKVFDAGSAFNAHIESTKKEEAKKAEALATQKYKSKLESKDKEIEKTRKESEQRAKNIAAKELHEKLQKKDDEIEKMKKSKEISDRRLAQKTEEMNTMMKQGSVELQGEIQEERLQDYLEKIFPDDDIEEISKGVKGGDCIQTINYKDKLNIAKIYFESKDTKIFNEQWANKLLKDMKAKGIANGIIVCSPSCMPTDFNKQKSYVERHGNLITIIPMIKPIIHAVVNRIRSILILKTRENKDHEIPAVMKKCWEVLNSPNFILPVKDMVSEIKNMREQLDKDKTSFLLSFSKKEKTIDNIKDSLTDMILPLINLDKNVFPENILIPQEKVKKLKNEEKDMSEKDLKPWMKKFEE